MSLLFARISLFIVYFWFGILKIFDTSPASPLVQELQVQTIPFLSFETFIILFASFEMLLGILFLIPKATKVAAALFTLHMIAVFTPLVVLPATSWAAPFAPTLEGQYIIKNIIMIALVVILVTQTGKRKRAEEIVIE